MYKIRHSGRDARIQSQGERSEGSVQCNAILGTGFQHPCWNDDDLTEQYIPDDFLL
ncbi:MAG: hypothetical protein QX189_01155 [Methylococcales bacterium]